MKPYLKQLGSANIKQNIACASVIFSCNKCKQFFLSRTENRVHWHCRHLFYLTSISALLFVSSKACSNYSLHKFHKWNIWPLSQHQELTKQNVWVFCSPFLLCWTASGSHCTPYSTLASFHCVCYAHPGWLSRHIMLMHSKRTISACLESSWLETSHCSNLTGIPSLCSRITLQD